MTTNESIWQRQWEIRAKAACAHFGIAYPPENVYSISWRDVNLMIPGSCVIHIPGDGKRGSIFFTLGLSQPLPGSDQGNAWELAVYTPDEGLWVPELLRDLMEDVRRSKSGVGHGDYFPARWYLDSESRIHASVMAAKMTIAPFGNLSGLYFWPDLMNPRVIEVDGVPFFYMAVIGVTTDEDSLAQGASPPHLLAALHALGVGQSTTLSRLSIAKQPGFASTWEKIRSMSERECIQNLREIAMKHSDSRHADE